MDENSLRIGLIGPIPPPYGGVSIYVQRIQIYLKEKGITCAVYDVKKPSGGPKKKITGKLKEEFLKFVFAKDKNIIHLQFSAYDLKTLIRALLFKLLGKKVIITYHSWRKELSDITLLEKFLFKMATLFISRSIVVSPLIKTRLIELGVKEKKLEIIPAFIAPPIKEEDMRQIPQEIWDFIDSRSPIISANASVIAFYDNQDMYGIDMCVALCSELKQDYPQIGFIFCLSEINNYEYFEKMKQKIKEERIEDNFLFQTHPSQMYPIIMKSNLFVRPTTNDGDSVSVREALYFKVPVVASDVCVRPEGAILFKSRNNKDFSIKVKYILSNSGEQRGKIASAKFNNNAEKIEELYYNLLRKSKVKAGKSRIKDK